MPLCSYLLLLLFHNSVADDTELSAGDFEIDSNGTNAIRTQFLDDNQRLYRYLFDSYNRDLPPIYTKRTFNNVTDILLTENYTIPKDYIIISLIYAKLLEVDSAKSLMTLIFEYTMSWQDPRLTWNITEFGGVDHLYINRKRIWVPEVTPFDSMQVTETRPEYKQIVTLFYNGLASFYVSTVVTTNCEMAMKDFPFDKQCCNVRLLSYSFSVWEIELTSSVYKTGNDEWEVLNITSVSMVLDEETNPTQINQFTFYMKRNPSYYTVLIIAPSFILTFLCIAGMFTSSLQTDDIDKIAMGLTTIMSSVVMISVLSQSIPKTKQIPKLSTYVTMNLLTVSAAISVAILVPKVGQFCWLIYRLVRCCYRKIRKQGNEETQEKKGEPSCCRRFTWLFKALVTAIILIVFEFIVIANLVILLVNENTREAFGLKN